MSNCTIKRVRKYGEARMALCAETDNRCFGKTVYEELQTGDLAVIINASSGDLLVDLDTFLDNAQLFAIMEAAE